MNEAVAKLAPIIEGFTSERGRPAQSVVMRQIVQREERDVWQKPN